MFEKLRRRWVTMLAGAALTVTASAAQAHKPSFDAEGYGAADQAYRLEDPAVSIVLYRTVTCEAPELWITFDVEAGFPLFVQLLVPKIDRLSSYRPSVAIVGPGLPSPDLPIELPHGMGALVYDTVAISDPPIFDEPFTQTRDFLLVEETISLPETGSYYLVAWDPDGWTGKLAVAVGTIEQFGRDDFAMLQEWTVMNQIFHETGDFTPAESPIEQRCEEPVEVSVVDGDAGVDRTGDEPPMRDGPGMVEEDTEPDDLGMDSMGTAGTGEAGSCSFSPSSSGSSGVYFFGLVFALGVTRRKRCGSGWLGEPAGE